MYILNRLLFKPINQILEERERLGAGRMSEARRMLTAHEERLNQYEARLREARVEAYQRLEAGRREAGIEHERMIAQVKADTSAQIDAAKKEIDNQAAIARQNLQKDAREMAANISSRILRRSVNARGD